MTDSPSLLGRLELWFASNCDGEWEHREGITIQTCDNPGWLVKICIPESIKGSYSSGRLVDISYREGTGADQRWLVCTLETDHFKGAGSSLAEILQTFFRSKLFQLEI